MNTSRVLHFPMIGQVIVALILLAVGGFAVLIAIALSLIGSPPSPSPLQADPLELVNTFHSAVNSDNVDAMLALFADDATVNDNGSVIIGKEEIRNWVLYSQRMAGLRLTLFNSEQNEEYIIWLDTAQNGPEAQYRVSILQWKVVIQMGTIKSLTVSLLPMPDGK